MKITHYLLLVAGLFIYTSARAGCTDSISSGFNSSSLSAGTYIWFHIEIGGIQGAPNTPFHVGLANSSIRFSDGSTNYNLPVPNADILFSATATSESYSYSPTTGYQIIIPLSSISNEMFVDGVPFLVPAGGLPGGVSPVEWIGTFTSDVSGLSLDWQWSAAAYTSFSADPNDLGIQVIHTGGVHSGVPNNYTSYVTSGARSSGGSNYSGSNSSTNHPTTCQATNFTTLFIKGSIYDDANGMQGTPANTVNGTGVSAGFTKVLLLDASNNKVVAQTANLAGGAYVFSNLDVGSYIVMLSNTQPGIGATVTTASLPSAAWVFTGEHIGSGSGSDGPADGKLTVTLTTESVDSANFGLEQKPVSVSYTAVSQLNPGGTITVPVPASAFAGSDLEDGTYSTGLTGKKVTLIPGSNNNLYYNGSLINSSTTITNFNSSLVALDVTGPNPTGYVAVTATFSYSIYDAAGVSSVPATITMPFAASICVSLRGYLEGALMNNGNLTAPDGRPVMRDNLRNSPFTSANYIPVKDPYEFATTNVDVTARFSKLAPQTTHPELQQVTDSSVVFGVTGQNAIVDWLFVELRNKANASAVVATRSALLQRDGDIVDVNGLGCLSFPGVPLDSYYVVVRHRSHLGAMTKYAQSSANLQSLVDLTQISTPMFDFGTTLGNGFDYTGLATNNSVISGYRALWAGDVNADKKIKYDNPSGDDNALFFNLTGDPNNTAGLTNYNFSVGYWQGDFNMDSKQKYDNPQGDDNRLFFTLTAYPQNTAGLTNYNFFIQQVP